MSRIKQPAITLTYGDAIMSALLTDRPDTDNIDKMVATLDSLNSLDDRFGELYENSVKAHVKDMENLRKRQGLLAKLIRHGLEIDFSKAIHGTITISGPGIMPAIRKILGKKLTIHSRTLACSWDVKSSGKPKPDLEKDWVWINFDIEGVDYFHVLSVRYLCVLEPEHKCKVVTEYSSTRTLACST